MVPTKSGLKQDSGLDISYALRENTIKWNDNFLMSRKITAFGLIQDLVPAAEVINLTLKNHSDVINSSSIMKKGSIFHIHMVLIL